MSSRTINIAIIGCGFICQKHIAAIKKDKRLKLVAVCDSDKKRAQKIAKKQKCKVYFDYEKLLCDKNIDLVSICTPSGLHPQMIEKAAQHKKHIICEKPLALNLSDGKKAVKACRQNKVKLFVVKQARYLPLLNAIKKAIEKKAFGKLVTIAINIYWQRPQAYFNQSKWRGSWKMDGGVLLNQANHHLDLLKWFGGKPQSVFCKMSQTCHKIEVEDFATAIIKFKNGLLASFQATTCAYPKNLEDSLVIIGQKGTVKIKSAVGNNLEFCKFKNYQLKTTHLRKQIQKAKTPAFGHIQFYKHVADLLLGKGVDGISGQEALRSLELIMACYCSAVKGKEVQLPLRENFKLSNFL
jgi:UDP-N-acetyl-2-amino-2-deoxyglucuronate dehydrogenase